MRSCTGLRGVLSEEEGAAAMPDNAMALESLDGSRVFYYVPEDSVSAEQNSKLARQKRLDFQSGLGHRVPAYDVDSARPTGPRDATGGADANGSDRHLSISHTICRAVACTQTRA
jgi:hypothetical protein